MKTRKTTTNKKMNTTDVMLKLTRHYVEKYNVKFSEDNQKQLMSLYDGKTLIMLNIEDIIDIKKVVGIPMTTITIPNTMIVLSEYDYCTVHIQVLMNTF